MVRDPELRGTRRTRRRSGSLRSAAAEAQHVVAVVVLVARNADARCTSRRRTSSPGSPYSRRTRHSTPHSDRCARQSPTQTFERHERRFALEVVARHRRAVASTSMHFSSPVKNSTTGGTRPDPSRRRCNRRSADRRHRWCTRHRRIDEAASDAHPVRRLLLGQPDVEVDLRPQRRIARGPRRQIARQSARRSRRSSARAPSSSTVFVI